MARMFPCTAGEPVIHAVDEHVAGPLELDERAGKQVSEQLIDQVHIPPCRRSKEASLRRRVLLEYRIIHIV